MAEMAETESPVLQERKVNREREERQEHRGKEHQDLGDQLDPQGLLDSRDTRE